MLSANDACFREGLTQPEATRTNQELLRRCLLIVLLLCLCAVHKAYAYDPMLVSENGAFNVKDSVVMDAQRERSIPIRSYIPNRAGSFPIVLFSHGLGGSREGSTFLGKYWAARGYAAIFLQHPGSDTSVLQTASAGERVGRLKAVANAQNLLLRVKDVTAVIDQLARWNVSQQSELFGRLDVQRIAMSGHSFGAVTTQAVSGQQGADGRVSYTDPRIRAAIVFSPSVPRRGEDPVKAFGRVQIPWMLMTGTNDTSPIGDIDVPERLAVFDALPPGAKYQLVLDGAEHSVFTDRRLMGDRAQRNPQHHAAILALSTAFLDAYLKSDEQAKQWLNDPAQVRRYLSQADRWQTK